jgi:hypothetical protein
MPFFFLFGSTWMYFQNCCTDAPHSLHFQYLSPVMLKFPFWSYSAIGWSRSIYAHVQIILTCACFCMVYSFRYTKLFTSKNNLDSASSILDWLIWTKAWKLTWDLPINLEINAFHYKMSRYTKLTRISALWITWLRFRGQLHSALPRVDTGVIFPCINAVNKWNLLIWVSCDLLNVSICLTP